MYLEIVTPEAVLLSAEVDSVSVPGVERAVPDVEQSRSYSFGFK